MIKLMHSLLIFYDNYVLYTFVHTDKNLIFGVCSGKTIAIILYRSLDVKQK